MYIVLFDVICLVNQALGLAYVYMCFQDQWRHRLKNR